MSINFSKYFKVVEDFKNGCFLLKNNQTGMLCLRSLLENNALMDSFISYKPLDSNRKLFVLKNTNGKSRLYSVQLNKIFNLSCDDISLCGNLLVLTVGDKKYFTTKRISFLSSPYIRIESLSNYREELNIDIVLCEDDKNIYIYLVRNDEKYMLLTLPKDAKVSYICVRGANYIFKISYSNNQVKLISIDKDGKYAFDELINADGDDDFTITDKYIISLNADGTNNINVIGRKDKNNKMRNVKVDYYNNDFILYEKESKYYLLLLKMLKIYNAENIEIILKEKGLFL